MRKLYCYVDESGQDTSAQSSRQQLFIVAVVVIEAAREELERVCEQYEQASGKGKIKWGKADRGKRLRYLRLVFADDRWRECLRFVAYGDVNRRFDDVTVLAIAHALQWKKSEQLHNAVIYVDGLSKTKRRSYTLELRTRGVTVYQVRGVAKDENSPLTRLADALAGFVRDALSGEDDEAKQLLEQAKRNRDVIEL